MNDDLTTEENQIINRIVSAAKWDILFHDLAYLVPSSIIIILSVINGSASGVLIGIITYSILHLWSTIRQCKQMPLFQSAIKKIMDRYQKNNSEDL